MENYSSIRESLEDATQEVDRVLGEGFAAKVKGSSLPREEFDSGTLSRLALVVEEKLNRRPGS